MRGQVEKMRFNSFADLAGFFRTPDRPISIHELARFWNSLTYREKEYYRTVALV